MSKQTGQQPNEAARLHRAPNALRRRWLLSAMLAAILLFAGALSPEVSHGAGGTPLPPAPCRPFDGGAGCSLSCPDSRSHIVWLSCSCAICCWNDFPFTCSEETCCQGCE